MTNTLEAQILAVKSKIDEAHLDIANSSVNSAAYYISVMNLSRLTTEHLRLEGAKIGAAYV